MAAAFASPCQTTCSERASGKVVAAVSVRKTASTWQRDSLGLVKSHSQSRLSVVTGDSGTPPGLPIGPRSEITPSKVPVEVFSGGLNLFRPWLKSKPVPVV